MLNIEEAQEKVLAQPGVAGIAATVVYHNLYLVRVVFAAEDEAHYDPFYSVDSETGAVNEFSFLHDGDPAEITALFLAEEPDDLEHTDESDDWFAHHGVKGMKWGVINKDKLKGRESGKAAEDAVVDFLNHK